MMNAIELIDFSCYYAAGKDEVCALSHLSFTVPTGELLVVAGKSGSGKSTLLKCILGMGPEIEGELLIGNTRIDDFRVKNSNIAYVRQEIALYPHLTVYENIAFPLRSMRTAQEEVDRRVKQIAALLEVDWLLTRKPKQLSGGQQQRIAIARALVKNPDIILMDEPFSNVEPGMRMQLRRLVQKIHKAFHSTIVFVTHDLSEAFFLADRILVLEDGCIADLGSPTQLRTCAQSDLIKEFLNS